MGRVKILGGAMAALASPPDATGLEDKEENQQDLGYIERNCGNPHKESSGLDNNGFERFLSDG